MEQMQQSGSPIRKGGIRGIHVFWIVVVTILVGKPDVWASDIEIPKKYGVDVNVGDTRGVSGIFRALRTIPVMLSIARDMEEHCPNALLLNVERKDAIQILAGVDHQRFTDGLPAL